MTSIFGKIPATKALWKGLKINLKTANQKYIKNHSRNHKKTSTYHAYLRKGNKFI